MKKLILASTASIAMLGLAACSDTDDTTTQSIDEPATTAAPMEPVDDGAALDAAPAEEPVEEPVEAEPIAPEAPAATE